VNADIGIGNSGTINTTTMPIVHMTKEREDFIIIIFLSQKELIMRVWHFFSASTIRPHMTTIYLCFWGTKTPFWGSSKFCQCEPNGDASP
jgi:hypothetical protein